MKSFRNVLHNGTAELQICQKMPIETEGLFLYNMLQVNFCTLFMFVKALNSKNHSKYQYLYSFFSTSVSLTKYDVSTSEK